MFRLLRLSLRQRGCVLRKLLNHLVRRWSISWGFTPAILHDLPDVICELWCFIMLGPDRVDPGDHLRDDSGVSRELIVRNLTGEHLCKSI